MSKTYLVGGAVRDILMGKKPHDEDFVVVGSSIEEMKEQGFEMVGADFPVFLHPITKDEYALARKDKKTGNGYLGFETYFSPDVTIEEDLFRRDLTMNAIALDQNTNTFIDPFNGISDIKNKLIKHVSLAFKEDPLRILRVARFSARFPDFNLHKETLELMRDMHKNGETKHLTRERIWKELSRALILPNGSKFFSVLQNVGLGKDIFPDMNGFYEDENKNFHIEGINMSEFDDFLKNSSLKERIAHWSLPISSKVNLNIATMWKSISAPQEVVDHIQVSCLIWNDLLNEISKIKTNKPSLELFEIIQKNDGYRRKERFLSAYDTVKKHFEFTNNSLNCMPDKDTLSNWIDKTTPTKEEIANVISNCEKSEIKINVENFKLNKQNVLIDSFNNKKQKLKY